MYGNCLTVISLLASSQRDTNTGYRSTNGGMGHKLLPHDADTVEETKKQHVVAIVPSRKNKKGLEEVFERWPSGVVTRFFCLLSSSGPLHQYLAAMVARISSKRQNR